MKVLWFTNNLMPDAATHIGRVPSSGSGWWMTVLLERLASRADIELAVAAQGGLRDCRFKKGKVEYFVVSTPWIAGIRNRLGSYKQVLPVESSLRNFAKIVKEWNPDVVHVHGTEQSFGLIKARGLTEKPVIVSIQGLMAPCARKAYGDLLPMEIHGHLSNIFGRDPVCRRRWKEFVARIPAEEAILRSADMVLGRTLWDFAWASASRPDVRYRHVDELMRREFSQSVPWAITDCQRHQIFCTSSSQPLKGLHVLLEAVHMLRQTYPDVHLNIAGDGLVPRPTNDFARFVLRLVHKWKMESNVTFLGFLNGNDLVEQLRRANCYAMPSFMENSCNALQEAMLVGIPCVTTHSGGSLTIVESECTGLTFPAGDAALLAYQIGRLFADDGLAVRLGSNGRLKGLTRNNSDVIEEQLMCAYREAATLMTGEKTQ